MLAGINLRGDCAEMFYHQVLECAFLLEISNPLPIMAN